MLNCARVNSKYKNEMNRSLLIDIIDSLQDFNLQQTPE